MKFQDSPRLSRKQLKDFNISKPMNEHEENHVKFCLELDKMTVDTILNDTFEAQ